MGVHRASHRLVRRPLQNVPLWGRLLTCGGLAIRLPALDAAATFGESVSTVCGLPLCGAVCQAARDLEDTPASGAPRGLPTRPAPRVSLPHSTWFTLPWRPW